MEIDKEALVKTLHETIVKVTFTKVNGDTRVMHCTLNEAELPEVVKEIEEKAPREKKPDVLAVWDVEAKGWRSFRWDSLIEWVKLEK